MCSRSLSRYFNVKGQSICAARVIDPYCCFSCLRSELSSQDEFHEVFVGLCAALRVGSVRCRVLGVAALPVMRARGGGRRGREIRAQPSGALAPERHGDRREAGVRSTLRESSRLSFRRRYF